MARGRRVRAAGGDRVSARTREQPERGERARERSVGRRRRPALHHPGLARRAQVSVVALVDIACFPLTGLLIIGLFTRYAAPALALAVVVSDLTLNHFWYGF
eukprot:1320764-Prymnesium_polylepis.1